MAGKGKPFTKGDTRINRKGRKKKGDVFSELLRDALLEVLDPATGYRRIDSIADKMVTQAQQGNKDARQDVLHYAYGKPVERIEQTNVNQNYDFSNLSLEERVKLLEQLRNARATVVRDNPDKL